MASSCACSGQPGARTAASPFFSSSQGFRPSPSDWRRPSNCFRFRGGHVHEAVLLHLLVERDPADAQCAGCPCPVVVVIDQGPLDDAALEHFTVLRERGRGGRDGGATGTILHRPG